MDVVIVVALLGGIVGFTLWGRRDRRRRAAAAATVTLVVDDWGVKRTLGDGRYEEISWPEVVEVRASTLPRGPWGERTRIVLDGGGERGVIAPASAAEGSGLWPALARLPGFKHAELEAVLDGRRKGWTVLWHRVAP
jgi:type II secretory pathway pseudopilin PulG